MSTDAAAPKRTLMDLTGYQWLVLFAAWLGWGFDVFDALLFNYVAPSCVPTLLGLPIGSPEAKQQTPFWVGLVSATLLLGWGVGGILFGRIADRIGRVKTLMLTMALYSVGTALCALAPNMGVLIALRFVASLGIGGEWAAGASMVAEVVPEKRRIEAGALLYTSSPLGLFLAGYVTYLISGVAMKGSPEVAWRYVFLSGLVPAAVAFAVRYFVKEPERWKGAADRAHARIVDLFSPEMRRTTLGGLAMAATALIMWWSCNSFSAVVASGLAANRAAAENLDPAAANVLKQTWIQTASNWFNLGGLLGTLLTIPLAKHLGRKPMFAIYFLAAAASIFATFGLPLEPERMLQMYFLIGLTVFGVFGSFTYALPELFPTRLRATGAGFCYNTGRFIAAFGPFLVGAVSRLGADALNAAIGAMFWVGAVPIFGLLALPLVKEMRGRALMD